MRTAAPLPRLPSSFTVGVGSDHGLSEKRMRSSALRAPFRGVRTLLAPGALADLDAFAVRMAPSQFFSHTSAARILRLRSPERALGPLLHVTSVAPLRATRTDGVVGHQVRESPRLFAIGGLRCTDHLRTWGDLAALLTVEELVVVGDGLVSRHSPVASMRELEAEVRSRAGRRGHRKLLAAVQRIRPRTDSARETTLRLAIVDAGLPEPVVNHEVRDALGRFVAYVDLAYPQLRLAIEYDGAHHLMDERQWNLDVDRLDALAAEGWRVIRVNRALLTDLPRCMARISAAIDAAS